MCAYTHLVNVVSNKRWLTYTPARLTNSPVVPSLTSLGINVKVCWWICAIGVGTNARQCVHTHLQQWADDTIVAATFWYTCIHYFIYTNNFLTDFTRIRTYASQLSITCRELLLLSSTLNNVCEYIYERMCVDTRCFWMTLTTCLCMCVCACFSWLTTVSWLCSCRRQLKRVLFVRQGALAGGELLENHIMLTKSHNADSRWRSLWAQGDFLNSLMRVTTRF